MSDANAITAGMPPPDGGAALPAELTIYTVGEWSARCQGWIDAGEARGQPLRVDASGVEEADSAGVQLLLSLARTLALNDRALVLTDPSAALVSVASRLGTAARLALPSETRP
jgi:anti-anti-sigma regulatory factor